ncbi:hypothetical protein D3C76_1614540 [compost metagenome]
MRLDPAGRLLPDTPTLPQPKEPSNCCVNWVVAILVSLLAIAAVGAFGAPLKMGEARSALRAKDASTCALV